MHLIPLLVASAAFLARLSFTQTVIPNTIPVCGQQCPLLIQAQLACVPPATPQTNQQTYTSCFCQFAPLAPMYGGTITGFCPVCSAADMDTTQNWFKGLCPNQGKGVAGGGITTTTTSSSTTRGATVPTTTSNADGTGSVTQGINSASGGSWISTHWKWVVMVIVLFIGLGSLAFGFWFIHRRYHRKKEAEIQRLAGSRNDLGTWGPGQSVHDISSPTVVGTPTITNEKGKSRDNGGAAAPADGAPRQERRMRESMRKSKRESRLRKAFL